jgi:hypothetical protein
VRRRRRGIAAGEPLPTRDVVEERNAERKDGAKCCEKEKAKGKATGGCRYSDMTDSERFRKGAAAGRGPNQHIGSIIVRGVADQCL